MSIANFIPALWAGGLLAALDNALQYGQNGVVNRDYEGEIRAVSDRVKINSIGDVTVKAYTKNSDIDAPEELTSSQQELIINQANYFNFAVDDVERVQARPDVMSEAMRRAAYGLRNTADTYLAGLMRDAVGADNTIGTTGAPKTDLGTAGKAYEYLVDLGVLLDQSNTPTDGRWVIVPPWFHGALQKDERFVGTGSAGADARLLNGMIGRAAGFDVLMSNNVPKATATTVFRVIAGSPIATSYAEQILEVEAFRPERRFSDAVKALHVYGAKVVRPSNLAQLIANKP